MNIPWTEIIIFGSGWVLGWVCSWVCWAYNEVKDLDGKKNS